MGWAFYSALHRHPNRLAAAAELGHLEVRSHSTAGRSVAERAGRVSSRAWMGSSSLTMTDEATFGPMTDLAGVLRPAYRGILCTAERLEAPTWRCRSSRKDRLSHRLSGSGGGGSSRGLSASPKLNESLAQWLIVNGRCIPDAAEAPPLSEAGQMEIDSNEGVLRRASAYLANSS